MKAFALATVLASLTTVSPVFAGSLECSNKKNSFSLEVQDGKVTKLEMKRASDAEISGNWLEIFEGLATNENLVTVESPKLTKVVFEGQGYDEEHRFEITLKTKNGKVRAQSAYKYFMYGELTSTYKESYKCRQN